VNLRGCYFVGFGKLEILGEFKSVKIFKILKIQENTPNLEISETLLTISEFRKNT
jgi:hypothetical protein